MSKCQMSKIYFALFMEKNFIEWDNIELEGDNILYEEENDMNYPIGINFNFIS